MLRKMRRLWLGRRESRFASFYADGVWGRQAGERYCSGPGSTTENAAPLVAFLGEYIRTHGIRSMVDLGCGDFQVGRRIDLNGARYIGVDIVSSLIDYNNSRFGSENVGFMRCDLAIDALPAADLCLVKQVLQHLSDAEILAVLPKLEVYPHVILVDGCIVGRETPGVNVGIPTGEFRSSGLYLEAPPFQCAVELLFTYQSVDASENFRVVRYRGRNRVAV